MFHLRSLPCAFLVVDDGYTSWSLCFLLLHRADETQSVAALGLQFRLDHVFVSVKFPRRLSTELLAFLHCFLMIVWSNVETRQIYGSLANILWVKPAIIDQQLSRNSSIHLDSASSITTIADQLNLKRWRHCLLSVYTPNMLLASLLLLVAGIFQNTAKSKEFREMPIGD